MIFKGAIILFSVFISLLFAEVILRTAGPQYYRFNDKSSEYYTNPRGYHVPIRKEGKTIIYGLKYHETPQRYRLPDGFSYSTREDKRNNCILGLGDSFTFGRGVRYEDIYLTRLEKLLHQNGFKIGIKNCGIEGAELDDIFEVYLYESSMQSYPLIIYGFVLNDFELDIEILGNDFIDFNNGEYRWNPWRTKSSIINFIFNAKEKAKLHNYTVQAYLDAFRGKKAKRNFETLRELNQRIELNGSKMVIVLFPLVYNFKKYPFKEIHDKLSMFCNNENIPLLDLLPAFSKYKAEELWVNPTDHHPNEIGHRVVADELYSFLNRNNLLDELTEYIKH